MLKTKGKTMSETKKEIKQDRFMFFANFAEAIRELPEEERAEAYKAICEYGIYGILPRKSTLKGMCIMSMPSLYKKENRGGNHNPSGKNQHSTNEVKTGQSGQRGQSGQSFLKQKLETETETESEKERNKKEKKLAIISTLANSLSANSASAKKILIDSNFSVSEFSEFKLYVEEMPADIINAVQTWLIKEKSGQYVDVSFIIKQFMNFAKRNGNRYFKENA